MLCVSLPTRLWLAGGSSHVRGNDDEKVERDQRRKAEKEAVGQRKMDDEMREVGVVTVVGLEIGTMTEIRNLIC